MNDVWLVRKSSAADVVEWVGALVALARREQAHLRFRSQVPIGDAVVLQPSSLPLPVRSRAVAACASYARQPSPALPFGELLVLVLMEPELPYQLQLSMRGFLVEVATDPRFPLVGEEVNWFFARRFPLARRVTRPKRTSTLRTINRSTEPAVGGAPVLSCNVWLEEQLLRSEGPGKRDGLFEGWLERYTALRGAPPASPKRSFRAAASGCEARLRRRGVSNLHDWRKTTPLADRREPGKGAGREGTTAAGRTAH